MSFATFRTSSNAAVVENWVDYVQCEKRVDRKWQNFSDKKIIPYHLDYVRVSLMLTLKFRMYAALQILIQSS
jgi:hypothetical protein